MVSPVTDTKILRRPATVYAILYLDCNTAMIAPDIYHPNSPQLLGGYPGQSRSKVHNETIKRMDFEVICDHMATYDLTYFPDPDVPTCGPKGRRTG